jgi:hypothetical protein
MDWSSLLCDTRTATLRRNHIIIFIAVLKSSNASLPLFG